MEKNRHDAGEDDEQKQPSSMEDIQPPATFLPDVLTRLGLSRVPVEHPLIALESGEWQERVRAIQALADLETQAPLQRIVECLQDEHEAVRIAALRALSKLSQHFSVPLTQFIEAWRDPHRHVRAAAIEILGTLKPEAISKEMLLMVMSDEDEEVRIAAIRVAETLGGQASVEQLVHMLRNDLNWQVREAAVYALDTLMNQASSEILAEALSDRSASVRKAAAAALGKHLPMKKVLKDLQYGETPVRRRMALLLGELGDQTPVEVLEQVALGDEDSTVRQAALLSLGQLEGRTSEKALRDAVLLDPDEEVRQVAMLVLAALYPEVANKIERVQRRSPLLGKLFGSYKIEQVLREDEWVIVCLGRHTSNKTWAIVRVLKTPVSDDRVEQFRFQAMKIAQLEHPQIVQVLDFDVQKETGFLISDCAGCENLRERYPKGTVVPLPAVVSHVKQVASTLQYAHDRGVIHQDIKPENMLLGDHGEILLDGFGISLLNPYETPGTVLYRAPEQINIGRHAFPASDQYTLAVVAYEWLHGEPPSRVQKSTPETRWKDLPSSREKVPQIPEQVALVITRAIALNPGNRFDSIQDFANALEQAGLSGPNREHHFGGNRAKNNFVQQVIHLLQWIFGPIIDVFTKSTNNRRR